LVNKAQLVFAVKEVIMDHEVPKVVPDSQLIQELRVQPVQ
jgi:hypothetical protein